MKIEQLSHSYNPNGLALINVSQEHAKAVGPMGIKRAEQELIRRRYNNKQNHHGYQIESNRHGLYYGN